MLFFQLHVLLFLISSVPVFATPIPIPHPGIKFSIAKDLENIVLYRLIDSHPDVSKQLLSETDSARASNLCHIAKVS